MKGKARSLDEIAERENLAERYVRRLAALAFLSPKVIRASIDETAPSDLTVTNLTQALPHSWAMQEQMFGVYQKGGKLGKVGGASKRRFLFQGGPDHSGNRQTFSESEPVSAVCEPNSTQRLGKLRTF